MARQFSNTLESPVVQTKAGKLRGFLLDGIYTFHGIPYADADRFQPPHAVDSWDGMPRIMAISARSTRTRRPPASCLSPIGSGRPMSTASS